MVYVPTNTKDSLHCTRFDASRTKLAELVETSPEPESYNATRRETEATSRTGLITHELATVLFRVAPVALITMELEA